MPKTKPKGLMVLAVAAMLGAVIGPRAEAEPDDHVMHVYKTPWCGCCTAWADHMRVAGYHVKVTELEDLNPIRKQVGVPAEAAGCHTAVVGSYVLEGHVPPEAITKLLNERPAVRGIAVPGMPMGSVGMGDDPNARYSVYAFQANDPASAEVFYEAGR